MSQIGLVHQFTPRDGVLEQVGTLHYITLHLTTQVEEEAIRQTSVLAVQMAAHFLLLISCLATLVTL